MKMKLERGSVALHEARKEIGELKDDSKQDGGKKRKTRKFRLGKRRNKSHKKK